MNPPLIKQLILIFSRELQCVAPILNAHASIFAFTRFGIFIAQIDDYFFPGLLDMYATRFVIVWIDYEVESVLSQHSWHTRTVPQSPSFLQDRMPCVIGL